MKINLHTHTNKSHDSFTSIESLYKACKKNNITCIAITDHDEISGAIEFKKKYGKKINVIIGEEIYSKEGDIIGLFLKKRIRPKLSAKETIKEIKKQKGLVMMPHPFDRLADTRIKKEVLEKIISDVDIIEVYNSKTIFQNDNRKAKSLARKNNKIMVASSDCHSPHELGLAYTEIKNYAKGKSLLEELSKGSLKTRKTSLIQHAISISTIVISLAINFFKRRK